MFIRISNDHGRVNNEKAMSR